MAQKLHLTVEIPEEYVLIARVSMRNCKSLPIKETAGRIYPGSNKKQGSSIPTR